ncbi:MAG: alpha/beta hydrolase [Candidatus Krumholzibacteriia bacterium]
MILKPVAVVTIFLFLAALTLVLYIGRDFLRRSSRVPPVPRGTTVYRDIAYVTNGHPRQKLDLYLPKGAENPPLMILIHGGGFKEGDKSEENAAQWLTQCYAVASLNYRFSSDAVFPAQIGDCKAAVRWLRANAKKYGYDSNRFGARGSSAGGYLVTMLGTTGATRKFDVGENLDVSSRVQAVADRYGPTDFLQMDAHRMSGGPVNNTPDSPASELIGGNIADNRDKVENANPINYVTKDCPPFIIVHGDSDPLVPHHQSELLVAALAKAGIPVTLYTVKGGGHGGFDDPNADAVVREFFARYLKPAKR